MMVPVIVDTNVAVVANGNSEQASIDCQKNCVEELLNVRQTKLCLLDNGGAILSEYLAQRPHGYPRGLGDLFFVWVFDNQANPQRCKMITITPLANDLRMFQEFPNDPDLAKFDPNDKKYVAVAIASGASPPILNAVDSDYKQFEAPLQEYGVSIQNLCPKDLKGVAQVGGYKSRTSR